MAPRMTIALLHKVAKNEGFLKALYIGIVETLIYSNQTFVQDSRKPSVIALKQLFYSCYIKLKVVLLHYQLLDMCNFDCFCMLHYKKNFQQDMIAIKKVF